MEEFSLSDIAPTAVALGTLRAGCLLERLLGKGAMGAVYLARRQSDGREVVVKVMGADLASDVLLRARFQREWEALRRIPPTPYVVRVHEVRETGDRPSIVMEFVPGIALDALLKERGRLQPADAVRIARDIALGLVAVHGQGLIHRDVKPANVIVGPDGRAKLVDFGLSKDLFMSTLTEPGQMLGTANYMAPEQWEEGEREDARCDLFSLGATLYHLVVGRPPFHGAREMVEIAELATSGDYPSPQDVDPELPAELELMIHRLLMPELRYRYSSAVDCAEDFARVLAGKTASIPCLVGAPGRFALLPARTFRIGSGPSNEIQFGGAGVAPRHGQIRRKAAGFVLQAIGDASITVGGDTGRGPWTLSDGDEVQFGGVGFTFRDPGGQAELDPVLRDAPREARPAPVVEALVALADPRIVLTLLERLAPDPLAFAADDALVAQLLGADVGAAVARDREAALTAARAHWPARLAAAAGVAAGATVEDWLIWWDGVRGNCPAQIASASPRCTQRLRGVQSSEEVSLDHRTVTLIGRDSRCAVLLQGPEVARRHAIVLRLHQRVVVGDALSPAGTFLDERRIRAAFWCPGQTLGIGTHRVVLEARPPEPAAPLSAGLYSIQAETFEALERLAHPSAATGLVGLLRETPDWLTEQASSLFSGEPERAAAFLDVAHRSLAERKSRAQPLVARLLGRDLGTDLEGWTALLTQAGPRLPPQLVPRGWLALSRGSP